MPEAIEYILDEASKELKEIEALKERFEHTEVDDPNMPFWRLAFGYGEHVNRAYIKWAEEAIAALKKMDKDTEQRIN
jgi:hypothetical protein